jgi:hypothetical protein
VTTQRRSLAGVTAAGALLLGTVVFALAVHRHAPIETWLVFRYALCWVLVALFAVACTAVGHTVVRMVAPALPFSEHFTLAFAAGVFAFATLVFLGGIAHSLGGIFFGALPLSMIALAGPRAFRDLWPELRAAVLRVREAPPATPLTKAILAFGALGVLLVYLPILAPENVSYDARWYHLAIAEQYAVEGAIRRFPEGLAAGTYPQTATLLYTWAFLSPLGGLFDRVELAAHLELVLFIATLAGIPVLVKRLVPSFAGRGSWSVFFLFPAIFVYDSELSCGADHVAALFAVPVFLALLRAWDEPGPRSYALLGVLVSGVLSVKYTAASVALGPTVAIFARAIQCALGREGRASHRMRAWLGLAAFAGVCLVLTAPYWLRNWVFYGDPVYPMLAQQFHPRPWAPDADEWHRTFRSLMVIPDTHQVKSVSDLLYVLATFSIDVHDFPHFHGKVPVFGSLFSIATLALPFLKGARSLAGLATVTYGGLAFWAILNPQDRYLQALLPWMVALTASVLILAWRTGFFARVASGLAVGLQILWGADTYFLPSHAMTRKLPAGAAIDLLGGRYVSRGPDGLTPFAPWPWIGRSLRHDARVLLHEGDLHLGIGVATVLDTIPFMYGIDYGRARSSKDVHELLRSMGVTHLLWQPTSHASDSLAGDLVFLSFASRRAIPMAKIDPFVLAAMPSQAPLDPPFGPALIVSCSPRPYRAGVYELADLTVPPKPDDQLYRYPSPRIRWEDLGGPERAASLSVAEFVVAEEGCGGLPPGVPAGLRWLGQRGSYVIYARP